MRFENLQLLPTALLTGSHAYGTPHENSDIDLVVLMDNSTAEKLMLLLGAEAKKQKDGNYPTTQVTHGKLNLIVERDPRAFEVWKQGTLQLLSEAPVTRERACEVFKALRTMAGITYK